MIAPLSSEFEVDVEDAPEDGSALLRPLPLPLLPCEDVEVGGPISPPPPPDRRDDDRSDDDLS